MISRSDSGGDASWQALRARLRGAASRYRLAQAARSHPAPIRLETGHFAPPNTYAVWHLPVYVPTFGDEVLQIIHREDGDSFTLRILPSPQEGA